jgi:hypothetical protein
LHYTEYGVKLIVGGKDLGFITYYYIPKIKVGIIEPVSLYKESREDALKLYNYALKALLHKGAAFVYVAGRRLLPMETLWEAP